MKSKSILFFIIVLLISCGSDNEDAEETMLSDDCVNSQNVHKYSYNGKNYEIVMEKKSWEMAAKCAVKRGGYLVEVGSTGENSAIFNQTILAKVDLNNTTASDGGGASYVWIGGNDILNEGKWIWDGNNDGVGEQFWKGSSSGSSVNGLYNNWGKEPDNFQGSQNGLALGLTQWPLNSGSLGSAKEWNDIDVGNSLYFVIEYD